MQYNKIIEIVILNTKASFAHKKLTKNTHLFYFHVNESDCFIVGD